MVVPWDHRHVVRDHEFKSGGPGRDHGNFWDIENFPMKSAYFAIRDHGFWSATTDFKGPILTGTGFGGDDRPPKKVLRLVGNGSSDEIFTGHPYMYHPYGKNTKKSITSSSFRKILKNHHFCYFSGHYFGRFSGYKKIQNFRAPNGASLQIRLVF